MAPAWHLHGRAIAVSDGELADSSPSKSPQLIDISVGGLAPSRAWSALLHALSAMHVVKVITDLPGFITHG